MWNKVWLVTEHIWLWCEGVFVMFVVTSFPLCQFEGNDRGLSVVLLMLNISNEKQPDSRRWEAETCKKWLITGGTHISLSFSLSLSCSNPSVIATPLQHCCSLNRWNFTLMHKETLDESTQVPLKPVRSYLNLNTKWMRHTIQRRCAYTAWPKVYRHFKLTFGYFS